MTKSKKIPWPQQDPDPCARKHGGVDTSVEAFKAGDKRAWNARCLTFIREMGLYGATPDECAVHFGVEVTTVRPRFTDLKRDGLIVRTGQRRATKSGCRAGVHVAAELAPQCGDRAEQCREEPEKHWFDDYEDDPEEQAK